MSDLLDFVAEFVPDAVEWLFDSDSGEWPQESAAGAIANDQKTYASNYRRNGDSSEGCRQGILGDAVIGEIFDFCEGLHEVADGLFLITRRVAEIKSVILSGGERGSGFYPNAWPSRSRRTLMALEFDSRSAEGTRDAQGTVARSGRLTAAIQEGRGLQNARILLLSRAGPSTAARRGSTAKENDSLASAQDDGLGEGVSAQDDGLGMSISIQGDRFLKGGLRRTAAGTAAATY